ncbi:MAG TPA: alpha-1,2-fucosyltransferase, partial [Saprospiraceae bacterium]|nr:alpha-1,2-fucosyltransferase [Saprospiraceae bacterium]
KSGYFDGYWQSEKYFLEIRDLLKTEFQLKNELWDVQSLSLLEKIRSCNSVSIHIRRGDYVQLGYTNTCGLQYYQKAIEIINLKIRDPHYFIFSNDIEWAKNNQVKVFVDPKHD